jgi:ectoine hydroxylase-related dioxygenase (phytanoyl-CoA dioxygenase family)
MKDLPQLISEYPLSGQQIERYQRDGFILLRQVCSQEEIEIYRDHISTMVQDYANKQKNLSERDTYGKAFLQIGNLWQFDEIIKNFIMAERFAKITAQLSKSHAIRFYHDQALYKERGGGYTPWHQDQYYWPLDTEQAITMWMPLVDASEDMGTMSFAAGSHKQGYIKEIQISDESENIYNNYVHNQEFEIYYSGDMQAGDATFHNGWTLHRAGPNLTNNLREVMTMIYYPDGTKLIKPDHDHRQMDFDFFFPGMKAGALAANEQTPVLYPRS